MLQAEDARWGGDSATSPHPKSLVLKMCISQKAHKLSSSSFYEERQVGLNKLAFVLFQTWKSWFGIQARFPASPCYDKFCSHHHQQLSEWLVIAMKTPIHTSWKYWFRLFSWGWVKQVWTNAHSQPFSAYYRQELTFAVGNGNCGIATQSCRLKICPCLYCLVFQQCSVTAKHKPVFYRRKKKEKSWSIQLLPNTPWPDCKGTKTKTW